MVRRQLEDLFQKYPITYSVVLAYLPTEKNKYDNLTNTIYPEGLETVPKRFAISWRNKWMIEQSDIVVTYVLIILVGLLSLRKWRKKWTR